MPKGAADGQPVNIPAPPVASDGVTEEISLWALMVMAFSILRSVVEANPDHWIKFQASGIEAR